MVKDLLWGIAFTIAVLLVCGAWFFACGTADKMRRVRPFAKRTLQYAGPGFLAGLALVTSDISSPPIAIIAFTTCCGLLTYAAGCALVASDDKTPVLVNLTGRPLLLSVPDLAPFYTLPAPQEEPATELPALLPRTHYIVSPELGLAGAEAGRTDVFTVDTASATDYGSAGLLVRRLIQAAPAAGVSPDRT